MTLKSIALVAYLEHFGLLNTSAVYRWLIQNRLTLMGFLPAKMETCKENKLHGEFRGECALYWFSGKEEVNSEEGMMPLNQKYFQIVVDGFATSGCV